MSQGLGEAATVLVSACLLGVRCRYDAGERSCAAVTRALVGKAVIPICPEAGAGLGIPRPPVELHGGDGLAVLAGLASVQVPQTGEDRTSALLEGARLARQAAERFGARVALLKERSPSCGVHRVWVDGTLGPGAGVAAASLAQAGLTLVSDEEL